MHASRLSCSTLVLTVALSAGLVCPFASAQSYEIVQAFTYGKGEPAAPLIETSDGKLYGTTRTGGAFERGSVFVLVPDGIGGYAFEELHSFREASFPIAPLVRAFNGSFYGTTSAGGPQDSGTVFKMTETGHVTILYTFGAGGGHPHAGLVQAPTGFLYGTSWDGGSGQGSVFRMDPAGNFESLHDFTAGEGAQPQAELVWAAFALYGTTWGGGANLLGTVFRMDLSGNVTIVHEFDGVQGAHPSGGLTIGNDGNLYGTTSEGGTANGGTIYRIDFAGGFESLHDFQAADGLNPLGALVLATDGKLYGTTSSGDAANSFGTVFRIDTAGAFEVVHPFSFGAGVRPHAGLIQGAGGDLFGTTLEATVIGWGTVFQMDLSGTMTPLHAFYTRTALYPQDIIRASDGKLYGTASGGGTASWGVAFEVSADGESATTHEFSLITDGGQPTGPLLEAADGLLYGTASSGGSTVNGTIFRIDPAGGFENIHDFDASEGVAPVAGLVQATDGDFYGTTLFGGANNDGIVFRLDSVTHGLTVLHAFDSTDANPRGVLREGSDARLYGTTSGGSGSVFAVATDGAFESLHTFSEPAEGTSPFAGLLLAADGFFYGTTSSGGASGFGDVFRIDATGNRTPFHAFAGSDGRNPRSPLVEDGTGNLYGMTMLGGSHGLGTAFRLDPSGSLTELHGFGAIGDGQQPVGGLVREANGDLYGVTEFGGPGGYGIVFRINAATPVTSLDRLEPDSGRAEGGSLVAVRGAHLPPGGTASFGGVTVLNLLSLDATRLLVQVPALTAGMVHNVVVTNPDSSTATLPAAWFADFADVPEEHMFHDFVEAIVRADITAGCGGGNYCVDASVTRAQMAVFLLKAEHGSGYTPPPCTGDFGDVSCPGGFAVDWIEQLAAEGVTAGCGGGNYCPGSPVTRAQMAVLLLKTLLGSAYVPPPATGIFGDVPVGSFAADWIEDLYGRAITIGCSASPLLYCPANSNTRGQMAVFLVNTFGL